MSHEQHAGHDTPSQDSTVRAQDTLIHEPAENAEEWLEESTEPELPPRPRRRLLAPVPLALLGVLMIAGGFIGGVLVEKGQTGPSGSGATGGLAARFAALRGASGGAGTASGGLSTGGAGFAGRLAGASGPGQATIGQVAYVEGKTLYVENVEGNTVKVTTSAASTVTKTVTSSVKGIHPGETVVVRGAASGHGTVAANSISVGGAGGLAGLFGGSGAVGAGSTGGRRAGNNASGSSEGPALFGK